MPRVHIVFYRDSRGRVPVLEWLEKIPAKAMDKCTAKIARLAEVGHELRRPTADYLEEGVYELRVSHLGVNYRILYFFHGREIAVLDHSLTKERRVPPRDIQLAIRNKVEFQRNPAVHTAEVSL